MIGGVADSRGKKGVGVYYIRSEHFGAWQWRGKKGLLTFCCDDPEAGVNQVVRIHDGLRIYVVR